MCAELVKLGGVHSVAAKWEVEDGQLSVDWGYIKNGGGIFYLKRDWARGVFFGLGTGLRWFWVKGIGWAFDCWVWFLVYDNKKVHLVC